MLREGGDGGGQEEEDPRAIKFWPKAKIVLLRKKSLAVTATTNSDKPLGE